MKSFSIRSFFIIIGALSLLQLCHAGGEGRQEKTYTASILPGEQNFVNYTTLYSDIVTLRCPKGRDVNITQPTWGRIVHGRELGIAQCYDNAFSCTLSGGVVYDGMLLLGNDDSGLYFCRSTGAGEEYYLNLTVLAPPQILGDVSECTSYHFCSQPHSSVDPSSDDDMFVISVEYYGANATIEWRYKGQTINFDGQVYNRRTVTNGLYHKTTLTRRMYHTGRDVDFTGDYTANITNQYGWNVSSVLIQWMCNLYPPNTPSNDTQILTAGDTNVKISCSVEFGTVLPHIAMCYAPNGESFTELNITDSCLFCDLQQRNRYCNTSDNGRIHSRPGWNVHVSLQNVRSCINRHITELEIPEVSMKDNNGIVYCTWGDLLAKMHTYEQHSLIVEEPPPTWIGQNWKYMGIGGGLLVALVLVVVMLLVVGLVHLWRKARRAKANRRRRIERRKPRQSISPPLTMPGGQTGSDMSDREVVFKPQRGLQSSNNSSSQCSAQVVLDAEVHDHSPLLPQGTQWSSQQYGSVSKGADHEPSEWTDAPLICTTSDEGDWRLPEVHRASKSNV